MLACMMICLLASRNESGGVTLTSSAPCLPCPQLVTGRVWKGTAFGGYKSRVQVGFGGLANSPANQARGALGCAPATCGAGITAALQIALPPANPQMPPARVPMCHTPAACRCPTWLSCAHHNCCPASSSFVPFLHKPPSLINPQVPDLVELYQRGETMLDEYITHRLPFDGAYCAVQLLRNSLPCACRLVLPLARSARQSLATIFLSSCRASEPTPSHLTSTNCRDQQGIRAAAWRPVPALRADLPVKWWPPAGQPTAFANKESSARGRPMQLLTCLCTCWKS